MRASGGATPKDTADASGAGTKPVEFSAPAFDASLPLPEMGSLSSVVKLRPLPRLPGPVIPASSSTEAIDRRARGLGKVQVLPDLRRLARDARLWAEDY